MIIHTTHFNLDQIWDSGQCFRMKPMGDGRYELIAGDRYLTMSQKDDEVRLDCSEREYEDFWADYFDLRRDYGIYINAVNPRDNYLTQAVCIAGGVRILKQDLWEMIVTFLISQQNNIKRIHHCIDLICEKYGKECMTPDGKVYYAFPTPEVLACLQEDELMECNLGYRSKYVVRTAQSVVSGVINLEQIEKLPYNKAKDELLRCYGIGIKVADCVCLFALHHLDAFPIDTHINQVLSEHYKRGFPNRRYKGFRGVLQQYIFYYELHKERPDRIEKEPD